MVLRALALSAVSKMVSTGFIGRHDGSDRNGDASYHTDYPSPP